MKNLVLIMLFICSCNQENKLITNNSIGYYKLGEQLTKDYNNEIFDISIDTNNLIKSIIVKSMDYKTKNGFGVGSHLNDIEIFNKESIKKTLTLSKGRVDIANLGISINYENILFVDVNDDGIVDYVLIQLINV